MCMPGGNGDTTDWTNYMQQLIHTNGYYIASGSRTWCRDRNGVMVMVISMYGDGTCHFWCQKQLDKPTCCKCNHCGIK